jgi:hypothetical protein
MPRGPQILTPQQQSLLRAARAAYEAHEIAEREAKAEYDMLMARRLQPARAELAKAVRDAISYGVPKSRVNQEALGVSTPTAWEKWVNLATAFEANGIIPQGLPAAEPTPPLAPHFAEAVMPTPEPELPAEPFTPVPTELSVHEHAERLSFVGDPAARQVRVAWKGYPSPAPDAPDVLEGVAAVDVDSPVGWIVVHDPQDEQTPHGIQHGVFTFEILERRGASPLREALNAYIKAANLPEQPVNYLDADDDEGF